MRCDLCGKGGAKVKLVTRTVGKGEASFVIRNVPVITCRCGESYLTTDTLQEIERMKLIRRDTPKQKRIPVATFSGTTDPEAVEADAVQFTRGRAGALAGKNPSRRPPGPASPVRRS